MSNPQGVMAHKEVGDMTAASDPNTRVWRDRKRYLWLMGLIVPTLL